MLTISDLTSIEHLLKKHVKKEQPEINEDALIGSLRNLFTEGMSLSEKPMEPGPFLQAREEAIDKAYKEIVKNIWRANKRSETR